MANVFSYTSHKCPITIWEFPLLSDNINPLIISLLDKTWQKTFVYKDLTLYILFIYFNTLPGK